jgi:hypothetical protein
VCTLRQVLPTADERERLLDVYRRRVAEHTAVDATYGPRLRQGGARAQEIKSLIGQAFSNADR